MPTNSTTASAPPDVDMLDRITRGDAVAFAEFYDRHGGRLYALAIRILKDATLAEDLLQEVFLALWKNARHFDSGRGSPLGWLMVLCRNRAIDMLRGAQRRRAHISGWEPSQLESLAIPTRDEPCHRIEMEMLQQMVRKALLELPAAQRQLLEMAYFSGLSQSEIAAELRLPLGTVKTRLRLGMQKLRSFFDDRTSECNIVAESESFRFDEANSAFD